MTDLVNKYLEEVQKKFKTGHAREHAYRPALESLIEAINPQINAVNDPKQQKVGAPDFVLLKGKTPIGYIEAKDIDVDLDKEFKTKNQFKRYKSSLNNLCFTNYLEFIFYLNGQEIQRVEIARLANNKIETMPENIELLESVLKNFTQQKTISIKSPKELAFLMAEKAKMLKNVVYLSLREEAEEKGQVEKQFEIFKQMLIHDLSLEQYADIYSQTIAYGMFAARYHDDSLDSFTRDEANNLLPKSNPFLRNFFQTIAGYNIDERIVWIVDDLAELFNHVNVRELLENYGKDTKRNDVIVHFYETFLAEYDPKMRKSRGVYYTPEPVVDFIVRAVDDILKTEFGIRDGLADISKIEIKKEVQGSKKKQKVMEHRVQILDPATGTGTFLDRVIKHIYNSKFQDQAGVWQSYVDEHLLPRLHGFEILMASYAMAHLKLDITLAETGYDYKLGSGKRLGVYLTNSLEEPSSQQRDLFSQWLTTESLEANEVKKEKPIMVVMGNPPYSGESANKGDWIMDLMEDYKKEPGGKEKLKEANSKFINADEYKFIRNGQYFIERNGSGVLAFINPHGFLKNPTFRGMRWHLLKTYDKIYTMDLHGNAKEKETTPDGSVDENVFDIEQGVSINIFVKTGKKKQNELGKVFHFDLYGRREVKYSFLSENTLKSTQYVSIESSSPSYFFTPKDFGEKETYEKGYYLSDLFKETSLGVLSKNDDITIDFEKSSLKNRIDNFRSLEVEVLRKQYNIKTDSRDWILAKAKDDLVQNFDEHNFKNISYRPFDGRWTYFTGKPKGFFAYTQNRIMKNMRNGQNYALISGRQGQAVGSMPWNLSFVTNTISDQNIYYRGGGTVFPLYLYSESPLDSSTRQPNLDPKIVDEIAKKLGLKFIPDHEHADSNKEGTFNPLDILDYIYAILHSPTYRERYKEFLKIDFPRIPFTSDQKLFFDLVKKGKEIREYHLMEHANSNSLITKYPISGENEVVSLKYEGNKVWINEKQYFEGVSQVAWDFYIGGYQPAQKWLKDRKGRKLSFDDVLHYQKIIVALVNTDRVMKEIDGLIPKWPIK